MLKGALRNTNWLKNTRHCQQICSEQDLTKSKLFLWDRDRVDTWRAALISKHLLTLYLDCKINPAQSIFSTPTNNHALPFRWEWYTANQSPPSVPWMCVCVCVHQKSHHHSSLHLLCLRPDSVSYRSSSTMQIWRKERMEWQKAWGNRSVGVNVNSSAQNKYS